MSILKVDNVAKRFGELLALDGVSLEVGQGTVTLLIGPNGSGKSTLLNCISGICQPDDGRIWYKGIDITGKPPHELFRLGISRTFQIPAPFKVLLAHANLAVASRDQVGEKLPAAFFTSKWMDQERGISERALDLLRDHGMYDVRNNVAAELSGGQMKILEMGRVLMGSGDLYLLDEPAGSVNPVLAANIFRHIRNMKDELGATFLIVEHRLDVAMKYADSVIALVGGKLLCEGSAESVLANKTLQNTYLGIRR